MKTHKAFLILSGILAAGSTVYADKVALSATPAAVQQAIRAKAGSHEIEDIDRDQRNGQVTYEASWKNNAGAQQELLLSETGSILRDVASEGAGATATPTVNTSPSPVFNKTAIALSETPRAVQASVYTQVPNAPIESVQRGTWNGKTFYEVAYHENGQAKTYRVDEAGKALEFGGGRWQPRYGTADLNLALTGGEKLAFEQSPRTVQRTMNYVANGAAIENLERAQWNGRTVYASSFRRNGETVNLQVFDDGTVVTKTPGVTVASTTPPTAKKQSFFDKASGFLNKGLNQNPTAQTPTTPPMNLAEAPRAVQQTVNQSTKGAALQDLQRSQWNGRTMYEAAFQQNGQNMKLQVLDDGSILSMGPAPLAVGSPGGGQSGTGRQ